MWMNSPTCPVFSVVVSSKDSGSQSCLKKNISIGAQYVILHSKQMDEENPNPTYACLAQENGFGSA
jgi:hypothetical protein